MTTISRDDVLHLAMLSSLQLKDDEIEALQKDLTGILEYVNQLAELDTSNVAPTYQVTDLENVWRDDTIDNYGVERGQLLTLAPDKAEQQIKVPKVL